MIFRRCIGPGRVSSLPALNRPGFLAAWLLCQGLALLLWSPWALPFVHQAALVDGEFWIRPTTATIIWEAFQHYNMAYLPRWAPLPWLWNLLYGLLALRGESQQFIYFQF